MGGKAPDKVEAGVGVGGAAAGGGGAGEDQRVLILAPRGRNAELIAGVMGRAGLPQVVCDNIDELCHEMHGPAGVVILCEEALNRAGLDCLIGTLATQPPWSEIPLLVLTGGGKTTRGSYEIARSLGPRGNLTLLERPVRIITMLSAVRAALRGRRRQYEVRDLLAREQAARAQAEAASKAKDHFLATLSHELRTPLNPVLMTVSAMQTDPALPPRLREDVDLVRRNVELESKLIDDLLDLTRIARGKLELSPEAVDLHGVLEHALETCCEEDARRKHLTVTSDLAAVRRFVWGDSARLSQVFWNLLKNAVKFTPEGGSIALRTRDDPQAAAIVVTVTDTGIGIEADAAARIFDAFEQENRGITRRFGGLGLGLAICKALVDLHGGTIAVSSQGKGRGATFTVRLATIRDPAPRGARPRPGAPERPVNGDGRAVKVLLVEDHEMTARVMARLLRQAGYDVTVAADVETAKRLTDERRFDVVISDLGLPDGTGLDVMKHLRARHGIPAIAVSGYGMEEDVRQTRDAGFSEHLVKPIDLPKLQAAIARVMGWVGR
jgi:signal transduction histidine kinase/methylmalonyl-CoA mutase cobalamin-binding subunit